MSKVLIVIDVQHDFIDGVLGTKEAQKIIPDINQKIHEYTERGDLVIFTRDTHHTDYLETQEGKILPVEHCIAKTKGWEIHDGIDVKPEHTIINKESFGWYNWMGFRFDEVEEVELVGVCTDVCVVSNAIIIKAAFPEIPIVVDASCCAGTTPEKHRAAIETMKSCQINIKGERNDQIRWEYC